MALFAGFETGVDYGEAFCLYREADELRVGLSERSDMGFGVIVEVFLRLNGRLYSCIESIGEDRMITVRGLEAMLVAKLGELGVKP